MDDKDNIDYSNQIISNQTVSKKKKKRKKKKNASKDPERNEAVIAMKNNIRQFWNDLPPSKRLSIINIEKENVLKRNSINNDIDLFYEMYYAELEKFSKDDENSRNEFFSTKSESDKSFKNNGSIHEKDVMPLIEEGLLDEQKFRELAKVITKKQFSDIDIEESYQNNSDENESELKEIYEDEENEEINEIEIENENEIDDDREENGSYPLNKVFHVISVRMFEHRILQAYKQHIAYLNQQKLFKELEQEKSIIDENEKNKAKKNEKKRIKRQILKLKKAQNADADSIQKLEKKIIELNQKKEDIENRNIKWEKLIEKKENDNIKLKNILNELTEIKKKEIKEHQQIKNKQSSNENRIPNKNDKKIIKEHKEELIRNVIDDTNDSNDEKINNEKNKNLDINDNTEDKNNDENKNNNVENSLDVIDVDNNIKLYNKNNKNKYNLKVGIIGESRNNSEANSEIESPFSWINENIHMTINTSNSSTPKSNQNINSNNSININNNDNDNDNNNNSNNNESNNILNPILPIESDNSFINLIPNNTLADVLLNQNILNNNTSQSLLMQQQSSMMSSMTNNKNTLFNKDFNESSLLNNPLNEGPTLQSHQSSLYNKIPNTPNTISYFNYQQPHLPLLNINSPLPYHQMALNNESNSINNVTNSNLIGNYSPQFSVNNPLDNTLSPFLMKKSSSVSSISSNNNNFNNIIGIPNLLSSPILQNNLNINNNYNYNVDNNEKQKSNETTNVGAIDSSILIGNSPLINTNSKSNKEINENEPSTSINNNEELSNNSNSKSSINNEDNKMSNKLSLTETKLNSHIESIKSINLNKNSNGNNQELFNKDQFINSLNMNTDFYNNNDNSFYNDAQNLKFNPYHQQNLINPLLKNNNSNKLFVPEFINNFSNSSSVINPNQELNNHYSNNILNPLPNSFLSTNEINTLSINLTSNVNNLPLNHTIDQYPNNIMNSNKNLMLNTEYSHNMIDFNPMMNINTTPYNFNNIQNNHNSNHFSGTNNLINTTNILTDTLESLSSPITTNNPYPINIDDHRNISSSSEYKDKSKNNLGPQSRLFNQNGKSDSNNKKHLMNKNSLEILQCLLNKE